MNNDFNVKKHKQNKMSSDPITLSKNLLDAALEVINISISNINL